MIRRIRRPGPDGDVVADRDMGPGPVGRMSMPGHGQRLFGAPIAHGSEQPMTGGERKRRYDRRRALELGR